MKQKLLVVELWALGDLVLATPFLRAAAGEFELTLLAKPMAQELQPRLWPGVEVVPFAFPWTAFKFKYKLFDWPWRQLSSLVRHLRARHFDIAASARWDPRDHVLLWLTSASRRLGFPKLRSGVFLSDALPCSAPKTHRYENWRSLARALGIELPAKEQLLVQKRNADTILIHTGAAQPARIWPMERFQQLAANLRQSHFSVQIVSNLDQRDWWSSRGEKVQVPANLSELMALIDRAGLFFGNDSGPGHLAAMMGVPTFTLFGNQYPAAFTPLHPAAQWMEGSPCPYKPCYDSCRFATPQCLWSIGASDAWPKLKSFAETHLITNRLRDS